MIIIHDDGTKLKSQSFDIESSSRTFQLNCLWAEVLGRLRQEARTLVGHARNHEREATITAMVRDHRVLAIESF